MFTSKVLMRLLALIFFLATYSLKTVDGQLPADFENQVEELVSVFLEKNRSPGLGLTVLHSDGLFTFTRGYGKRNVAGNVNATENTLFAIASISKSFAATIVSKTLNEKFPELGESALDTPIAKLAPALNFSMSDRARSESLSFRDLLSHRTCISPSTLGRTVGAFDKDEYIFRTRYAPEICPFRTGYTYNNAMFGLAGELIAQINGTKNYATSLSNFLQELGMTNSKVVNSTENYGTLPNFATPYYINEQGNLTMTNPDLIRRGHVSLGSGGVITSPQDMVKYLMFRLNNGRVDGKQVVPASVLNWTKKPSNPFNFNGFQTNTVEDVKGDFAYALGLNIGFYKGRQLISHDGFWTPFASRMSMYPSLKLGLFSCTNGPGRLSGPSFESLHNSIVDLLQDPSKFKEIKEKLANAIYEPWPAPQVVPSSTHDKESCGGDSTACIKLEPRQVAGEYGNGFHGDLQIVYNSSDPNGELKLVYGIWGRGYLQATSSTFSEFVIEWTSDIVGDFLSTADTIPKVTLTFKDADTFDLDFGELVTFRRDATLTTLPAIPWDAESCSP